MSGTPHNRFSDDIRMSAMSAVIVQRRPVKAVAAEHGVDPHTLRTWLCGRRGEYLKPPRGQAASLVPARRCLGHSESSADGRCPAIFRPESRVMFLCPTCRRKGSGAMI